jgi:hypothetical protein
MLKEVFGIGQAAEHYNPGAQAKGQPLWPTDREAARAALVDPQLRQAWLAALSPTPRPEGETLMLEQMVMALVRKRPAQPPTPDPAGCQTQVDPYDLPATQTQRILAQLVPVIDWKAHVINDSGYDHACGLAYRALDSAIPHGTFDLVFPLLSPHLRPSDQVGTSSLLWSILMECRAGNPAATAIRTDLKQVSTPEVVNHLGLVTLLYIARDEDVSDYGALQSQTPIDPTRPFPAKAFRDCLRKNIQRSQSHSPEQMTASLEQLDTDIGKMLTHPHPCLKEHHDRLYEAFRALRPHVGEQLYLAEERQQKGLSQTPQVKRPRQRG